MRSKHKKVPRRCRPARTHRDCACCGQGWEDGRVCGRCREQGIDEPVIPGTARVRCSKHTKVSPK